MDPAPQPTALRREVELPGSGGHGALPVVVLAAAMMSTVAAAALALSAGPRARPCPGSGRTAPALAPAASFARPAAPRARTATMAAPVAAPAVAPRDGTAPVALDPACAPHVYRGAGDVQEWTFETCASAPMPRRFVLSAR